MNGAWYEIDANEQDSPALLIYPERVKENIRILVSMIDDVNRLRPHVKTNKSKEACQLMIDAGIRKFKCATIAEAEMLATIDAQDILLAYQPVGPKLKRFAGLVKKYPSIKFTCLVDNQHSATEMDKIFSEAGLIIDVYLDLNVGMNRTGIAPGDEAFQLYVSCNSMSGIKSIGLHVYDGHIRDNDFEARTKKCDEAFQAVIQLKEQLREKLVKEPIIVAGGTPTFPIHCRRKTIECSPGTFIYWDKGYQDLCQEQKFLPAALVMTRVISKPAPDTLCLDLGHKSIAPENELARRVYFLDHEFNPVGQSEEHLVVKTPDAKLYSVGDVIYGIPYHICPTVALHERAFIINDRKVIGEWRNIARDRKISL